jgi:MFS transporter, NNP family, nitrate/nitrite transporter
VPILVFIAGSTLIFGQDHPSGRWQDRPNTIYLEKDRRGAFDNDNQEDIQNKADYGLKNARNVDTTVQEPPTLVTYFRILASPPTWLPPLAYMTTFGLELAIDGNLANVLFALFNKKRPGFGQTQAGYYTSIL